MGMPFLIVNNPDCLNSLRELGFNSFIPMSLLIATFSYIGIWKLYRLFNTLYKGMEKHLASKQKKTKEKSFESTSKPISHALIPCSVSLEAKG